LEAKSQKKVVLRQKKTVKNHQKVSKKCQKGQKSSQKVSKRVDFMRKMACEYIYKYIKIEKKITLLCFFSFSLFVLYDIIY